jgi:hypothetical protein
MKMNDIAVCTHHVEIIGQVCLIRCAGVVIEELETALKYHEWTPWHSVRESPSQHAAMIIPRDNY